MSLPPITPSGVSTAFGYPVYSSRGPGIAGVPGVSGLPPDTNPPIIWEMPPALSGNNLTLAIIASGGTNWGGCQVWASIDNATYGEIGLIPGGSDQGFVTADFPVGTDPDTTDTLSIDLTESLGTLLSATMAQADYDLSLAIVGDELISYTTANLTATYMYDLTTYIRRGQYGTTIADHPIGDTFGRIDANMLTRQFPANLIGATLYLKFPSYNPSGYQLQDLADVPYYTYTLTGVGLSSTYWFQSFAVGGKFTDLVLDEWDNNYEIFDVQAPVPLAFTINLASSPTPGCEIAPSANVTLTIQTIHAGTPTTVGTLTIPSGMTSGSYTVSAGFIVPPGDRIRMYAPSGVDTTIAGLFGTIIATKS